MNLQFRLWNLQFRLWCKFAIITALPLFVAGCSSSMFEGHESSIENQIIGSTLGVVGITDPNAEKKRDIKYNARSELVVPPKTDTLPQPQEKLNNVADVNWPADPDQRRASMLLAASEKDKPLHKRSSQIDTARLQPEDQVVIINGVQQRQNIYKEKSREGYYDDRPVRGTQYSLEQTKWRPKEKKDPIQAELGTDGLPKRKYLTDPPKKLMSPSETADYNLPEEKEKKGGIMQGIDPERNIERGRAY